METKLSLWHDIVDDKGKKIYTHDSWTIPVDGTEIWCTAWKHGQTIKPYGDGCHVIVAYSVYHCDELMGILERQTKQGHSWGIEGVKMEREQRLSGEWKRIDVAV